MSFRQKFKVPKRLGHRSGPDYHRACDRCEWRGWLRSQLRREDQTNLLVCPPCLDKRVEQYEPNPIKVDSGLHIID